MNETKRCCDDRRPQEIKCVVDRLQAELAELQRLDDLRRAQRDNLKKAAGHAFKVWADPCSSPEAVAEAMFAMRAAREF